MDKLENTMELKPLFESSNLRLTSIDPEKDAVVESKWTHDPEYVRMFGLDIANPKSVFEVKQQYEQIEKKIKERRDIYYFAVRQKNNDRLIGMAHLDWIELSNGNGSLRMGIGNPEDRGKGWGHEILEMLLRFSFAELNMHRITGIVPEYNQAAKRLLTRHGFKDEVVRRKALNRQGHRWDLLYYGLLRSEWEDLLSGAKEKE